MQKLQPLADRVIIRATSLESVTTSGIIIPESANPEKPQEGTVIAVGPGRIDDSGKLITPKVKEGDRVLFSKYVPDEIKIDGEDYLVVREDSILAIIN